jgi:DNA-binding CsgD family transcriptional regulator
VGIPASHPPDPRERAIEEHLSLVRAIAGGTPAAASRSTSWSKRDASASSRPSTATTPIAAGRSPRTPPRRSRARSATTSARTTATPTGRPARRSRRSRPAAAKRRAARRGSCSPGGWATLSERERRLLELRYFGDLTQAQIAQEVGLSQAQVSRLLRATLDRLRTELGDDVAGAGDRAYSATDMATPAPEPEEPKAHSGRLLVRMPPSLHTQLAETAEREGVSLNTLVTGALAGAVGWRDGGADEARHHLRNGSSAAAPDDPPGTSERRRTLLSVALAANFAIVAIAAVLAIVLLVVAWQGG